MNLIKAAPQIMGAPGIAGQILRMLGEGNPLVEQMADALTPGGDGEEQTPAQLSSQLQQANVKLQQVTQFAQQLHQAIQAKLPEIEQKKWSDALKALTSIRVAEINASKDADNANADRAADHLSDLLGWAHDAAMQATEHEHQRGQAAIAGAQDQQSQQMGQEHEQQMAQQAQENEPAGVTE